MNVSESQFTHKRVINTARILLVGLTPALLFSIFRAFSEDGAYGIIAMQTSLWLLLLAVCIERVPFGLKGRIAIIVSSLLIVALGAMLRNQNVFAAMSHTFLAGIFITLIAGRFFLYVLPIAIVGIMVAAAWVLNYITAASGLSHLFAFSSVLVAAVYLLSSMQQQAEETAQQALDAKDKLELMTANGDVGLFELDLEDEVLTGNSVWKRRFGIDDAKYSVTFAEIIDALSHDYRKASYDRLAVYRAAPVGYQHSCTIEQRFSDGTLHRVRINERKVERNGRHYMLGAAVDVTTEYESSRKASNLEEQIALVSRAGGVGLIEFFPDTRTFKCNEQVSQRLGIDHTDEEQPIDLFYAYQTDETIRAFLKYRDQLNQLNTSALQSFVPPFYHSNGDLHYYRVSRVKRELDGRVSFLGLSLDITEEMNANKKYESVYHNLKAACEYGGLYLIHTNLTTGEAEYIIAPTKGESVPLSGDDLFNAVPPEYHQALIAAHSEIGLTAEFPLLYPGWSEARWLREWYVKHWVDEAGAKHAIILIQDIHEQKMRALELEQALSSLNQEQQKQAQMYAVIGHELRTPAASMKMLLDDLDEGESLDSALVGSNIEHLLGVIDTLRAVAQPERMAQAGFKDVVIEELLSTQVANLSGLAERSGVTLTADLSNLTNEPVHIQSSLLRQVTSNLIKNAIIHSEGDRVHLYASGQLKGDHTKALTIRILDNGKGIADSEVDKLFEAYERGDSNAEGTGLGLFVCKEIITMMGGDIHYETSEQGGAAFVIELVVTLSEKVNKPSESVENLLQGKRVLMAEDNSVIQMLTAKMLKKQGATVVVNSDGQQALNAYSDGAFDLVMSDIFMPELDGYGLVRGLRERGYTGPIVGLTAATIGAETDLMLEAGADIVISKPIELEKLQTFLREYHRQSAN